SGITRVAAGAIPDLRACLRASLPTSKTFFFVLVIAVASACGLLHASIIFQIACQCSGETQHKERFGRQILLLAWPSSHFLCPSMRPLAANRAAHRLLRNLCLTPHPHVLRPASRTRGDRIQGPVSRARAEQSGRLAIASAAP